MGEIWNVINRKWRANYDDVTLISLIAKIAKENTLNFKYKTNTNIKRA